MEFAGFKLKLAITGAGGLLGRTFQAELKKQQKYKCALFTKMELDITNRESIFSVLRRERPDWVINCAAFTNVDIAEVDPIKAFEVNSRAMGNLAQVSRDLDIKVMHFSTDYVFDGLAQHPYTEDSATNPINQYGLSKLAGEEILLDTMSENAIVVRTAWLYGSLKSGFLSHLISKVQNGEESIQLVDDQVGQLTLASDVVNATTKIIDRENSFSSKVLHITNQGSGSWQQIGQIVNDTLNGTTRIEGVSHKNLMRPALRPNFSALDARKYSNEYGPVRNWTDALIDYLINSKKAETQ